MGLKGTYVDRSTVVMGSDEKISKSHTTLQYYLIVLVEGSGSYLLPASVMRLHCVCVLVLGTSIDDQTRCIIKKDKSIDPGGTLRALAAHQLAHTEHEENKRLY